MSFPFDTEGGFMFQYSFLLYYLYTRISLALRLDEMPEGGGYSPQEHSGEAARFSTRVLAPSEY